MTKITVEYTAEERQEIIQKLRAVSVAQAELWDTLHAIENERECSIDIDLYLVGELAGGCNVPPSFSDLSDEDVWEHFEMHAEATQ